MKYILWDILLQYLNVLCIKNNGQEWLAGRFLGMKKSEDMVIENNHELISTTELIYRNHFV